MSSLLPLSEASPNAGPVTPRTTLGPASAIKHSSRSSIKSSSLRSSKSEYGIASITRSTSHSSITKPKPVTSTTGSARKSSKKLSISNSRSSIGLSSVLRDPESAKKFDVRSDRKISVTPGRRSIRILEDDEDDSMLPSSPFEQYPGMGNTVPGKDNTPTASNIRFISDQDTREGSETPRALQTPRQRQNSILHTPSTTKTKSNSILHTPSTTKTKYLLDLATPGEILNVRFSPSTLSSDSTPTQNNQKVKSSNFEACLLDLDFPTLTPRSVPTMSSRQVESLKAEYFSEIATLKAELAGKDAELMALRQSLRQCEERNVVMEQQCLRESDRLEKIAKELHLQYSKKHETKVIALKKQLETKWAAKLEQSEKMVEELKEELEIERKEKGDLVHYCEQYMEAEQMDKQILQDECKGVVESVSESAHERKREE
ncbi:hypothetical protein V1520DRAFT_369731 [Lipomyces starkeyi]|uniref:Uncharacterized protein n=1 Tax=Lipomyces starkeyi NRRL Y-11557 TaxID=675824 RepID=A0A1E3PYG6_LIPST|nr:hypothetical protein LIPSTDRAFT_65548 [Lipomyces starkeyi NRRL Y-11557]